MDLYTVEHDDQVDWYPWLPICLYSSFGHIHIGSLILIRRFVSKDRKRRMVFCVLLGEVQWGAATKGDTGEVQGNKVYYVHRS